MRKKKRSETLQARIDHDLYQAISARCGPRGRSAFVVTAARLYLAVLDVLEAEGGR